ncbi:MAG: undecaprenyl/decaprenyl-phosphate alpha-N-acetylglucosaminyl 1-phosphate transferase [Phycisphaerales bacterium]|nr:undecaprenyl/decaprenyl-phosphate alpha-N-acetylglucosaminyl 1-phosphate transferase [Phycisphaerales bacterium]
MMWQAAAAHIEQLTPAPAPVREVFVDAVEMLNVYSPVFIAGFLITLAATPVVRHVAVVVGVIDTPDLHRKHHKAPVAYLGGLAVFIGFMCAMVASFILIDGDAADFAPVPLSILIGASAIAMTGLADDIWKWDARLKIAGQLVAAAALSYSEIGIGAVTGVLQPLIGAPEAALFSVAGFVVPNAALYYWVGTAFLGFVIIAGCNSANLIDGLDGLLSGSTAIMAAGFLAIALLLASIATVDDPTTSLVGVRVILALALLGTMLGFLPWNFNPAVIFLGDCGSLLIGYLCVTTILLFGEQGSPSMVVAGFIIFGLPIVDTTLAIIRRKLAGVPMNTADANHLHHQIKRALGSVKKTVFALYGITCAFTILGVAIAAIVLLTSTRVLVIYCIGMALFGFVISVAIKIALLHRWNATPAPPAESDAPDRSA